jgi:hypothetical protein
VELPAGYIPYAAAFGLKENTTTLEAFRAVLDDLFEGHSNAIEDPVPPPYIFSSLPLTSPLAEYVGLPSFLDPQVTELETKNLQVSRLREWRGWRGWRGWRQRHAVGLNWGWHMRQFYLGPAGSGAPMHFHR